jgi:hypothetical protein
MTLTDVRSLFQHFAATYPDAPKGTVLYRSGTNQRIQSIDDIGCGATPDFDFAFEPVFPSSAPSGAPRPSPRRSQQGGSLPANPVVLSPPSLANSALPRLTPWFPNEVEVRIDDKTVLFKLGALKTVAELLADIAEQDFPRDRIFLTLGDRKLSDGEIIADLTFEGVKGLAFLDRVQYRNRKRINPSPGSVESKATWS